MPYQEIEVYQPHHPDNTECDPQPLHAVLSNTRGRPLHQLDGCGHYRGGEVIDLPLPCLQVGVIFDFCVNHYQPPSPKGEGAEVSKMAIRVWAGGYAHGGGLRWRPSVCPSVRLSVCSGAN